MFVGLGMLWLAIGSVGDGGGGRGFLVFWCLTVVAVVGLNVWAAFATKGSEATIVPFGPDVEDDDADRRSDRR